MTPGWTLAIALLVASAALTALLIVLLRPWLLRYAMARPNARSSHRIPTPQGGGIAVIAAVSTVLAAVWLLIPGLFANAGHLAAIVAAAVGLALVGAVDDIRPLDPGPRLALQAVAVVVVLTALPAELRVVQILPWWAERALMALGLIWFVNLVNFMDGLDWITVAEIVPISATLAFFGATGSLPIETALAAAALCGAMLGFAPFNKPVARLFLGDVGSLPIGLLTGWLLIVLAETHLVAALLLPLYYLADATITLGRRFVRGERVTQAHRSHFYQHAADAGMSALHVSTRAFVTNVVLAALAALSFNASPATQMVLLACGSGAVALLLANFGGRKRLAA
jgi:UDP-N-acetylmuramyl pentapeptide phosphotransferase/UDP-N-acetylglucosamine-1-phosphate transferase